MLLIAYLLVLFLLVFLGFYIFVADPRSRANQTFAAFIAFLAFWTTKDLVFWNFFVSNTAAWWWAAISFVTAMLMLWALAVFAWVFPENLRTPRKKAAVLFAPGIVLVPAVFAGLLWTDVGFRGSKFHIELTVLAYAFVAYIYFVFFYGAYELVKKYRRYSGSQKAQQLGAIIWGLGLTGLLKTIVNIVLPFFGYYELLRFSAIVVLPGVFIYAYAITNFKLFSLQSALEEFRLFPITYKIALSIASVAIFSFLIFQIPIAWWAFRNGMNFEAWQRYLVFSVISALVPNLLLVLLVVRSISRPLQKITVAAVQVTEGNYGTEVDLRKTNDEIGLLANSFNEMSRKMADDIERLRSLNEKLAHAERLAAMGKLSAGVAHEVNNPLAAISSLVQMIRNSDTLEPGLAEKLDLISTQIQRITQVTRDLTDFARIRPSTRIPVNLNDVVDASLRLANFDEAFARLRVSFAREESLPLVLADSDQLQQVVLNLLLNSRDAMPGGGRLDLSTSVVGDWLSLNVSDSGTGIDEDDRTKLFEPFFTTKPAGKGTGLGLAVCYGIITAHGGRIDAERNPNGGSTFSVKLPTEQKPDAIR